MSRRLPSRCLTSPGAGLPAWAATVAVAAAGAAVLAGCGSRQAPGAAGPGAAAEPGSAASAGAASASSSPVPASSAPASSAPASSAPASSAPVSTAPASSACAAADLRVRLDVAVAGVAAGSYFVPLEFTNTAGYACRLAGYPAVSLTSGVSGQQIGTAAALDHAVRAAAVMLAPGGTAHAWLQVVSAANIPAGQCHPVTAAGLRVAAPGTQGSRYLPHPVSACRQGGGVLTVHPVQPGRARRGTA